MPRVAVFQDLNSASVYEVLEGARDLCRIVWIIGWSPHEPPTRPLARFGEVVDITGLTHEESVKNIVAAEPDGVVLFSDPPLVLAAAVAAELGLPFHSPHTAWLLSDKVTQRAALQEAGVPSPTYASVRVGHLDVNVPFPAVLKPRTGAGARDTFKIDDANQLSEALARCNPEEEFILEEWLADRSRQHGLAADMVCVETVVRGGEFIHFAVTGRFPIAPPFRSTGSFIPSDLNPADMDSVLALTSATLEALHINHGLLNTDIKMTPDGPRIIEINGRLGGNVRRMISRLGGPSMFVWAMRLALGLDIGPVPVFSSPPVAFYHLILAPPSATEVVSLAGTEELTDTPGIDEIRVNRYPGDALDSRATSQLDYVIRFDGMAESNAELNDLVHHQIPSAIRLTYR
jgi:biotin carboxylase